MLSGALVLTRKLHGATHPRVAPVLTKLADVAVATGRYDVASERYKKALAVLKDAPQMPHHEVSKTLAKLGDLHYRRQEFTESDRCFRDALEMASSDSDSHARLVKRYARILRAQQREAEAVKLENEGVLPDLDG